MPEGASFAGVGKQPGTKSGRLSLAGSHRGGRNWFGWLVYLDVSTPFRFPREKLSIEFL